MINIHGVQKLDVIMHFHMIMTIILIAQNVKINIALNVNLNGIKELVVKRIDYNIILVILMKNSINS